MNAFSLIGQRSPGQHVATVQEVLLREKILKDSIVLYGFAMSAVAGVCGILLYLHL